MPLVINGKSIDRISGPVSFSLLKPKKYVFNKLKKEGVHLPIIMMFGDRHGSDEDQCGECNCDLKGCCMPIYSDEFLQLIDSLATKEHPVDFSGELFLGQKKKESLKNEKELESYKHKGKEPMKLLRENILACYIKELRGTSLYQKHCPTKNIRWQFADIRTASESKYKLEYLISSFRKFFENIYNSTNADDIKASIDSYRKFVGDDSLYREIIEFQYLMSTDIEDAVFHFFLIADYKNSLIYKQISRLSPSLNGIELWEETMKSYLNYTNKYKVKYVTESRSEFYKLLLEDDYITLEKRLKDKTFKTNMSKEPLILLIEKDIFIEFYYILRTFKVPKGDVNPFLSLSFFGDVHRGNIFNILVNILGYYEVVESVNNERNSPNVRCITIPSKINLNELASEYK